MRMCRREKGRKLKSTYIRDHPKAMPRQSQVWWSTATPGGETVGGGKAKSRQALSVAFVALQVVGPRRLYCMCYNCYWCSRNGGFRC